MWDTLEDIGLAVGGGLLIASIGMLMLQVVRMEGRLTDLEARTELVAPKEAA